MIYFVGGLLSGLLWGFMFGVAWTGGMIDRQRMRDEANVSRSLRISSQTQK
jgi:hypothetical protein